jgi:hypothetical protein
MSIYRYLFYASYTQICMHYVLSSTIPSINLTYIYICIYLHILSIYRCVAQVSGTQFARFYPSFMPGLIQILAHASGEDMATLRGIYVYIYRCIYMYMYVYVCMHVCMYVYMYVCMYICMYVYMYVCMFIYISIYIYFLLIFMFVCVYVYLCIYVCLCIYARMFEYICVHMHVCIYACGYPYVCVCAHVCFLYGYIARLFCVYSYIYIYVYIFIYMSRYIWF